MAEETKKAIVEELFAEGMTSPIEIRKKTGFSYGYVRNIVSDIKSPGSFKKSREKYFKTKKGQSVRKRAIDKWRGNNPDKVRAHRKKWRNNNPDKVMVQNNKRYRNRQEETIPTADNRYQEWTVEEIKFLEKNKEKNTIKEMALALNRTYGGVNGALTRFNLRA